ncbi:hypothetical protein HPP92_021936 [Vanilla planifolia]|uniref:Secreted protein n=1 Tax=Vanilla planifolia TaxID=51239 RepID=A0A835Q257_VANPL|nr:hypothetical protein HPP92_021936 [Vanilla planifolia]
MLHTFSKVLLLIVYLFRMKVLHDFYNIFCNEHCANEQQLLPVGKILGLHSTRYQGNRLPSFYSSHLLLLHCPSSSPSSVCCSVGVTSLLLCFFTRHLCMLTILPKELLANLAVY